MLGSGSTLGPYRIEREIGRGGMGVVFLARDTRLGRLVAIKALPEDVASDPDRMTRFEREAKALASLSHPNIAGIYGLEESDGRRYLALEYVEGESLADRLARGTLSPTETVEVGLQIAAGIEAAHEAGIVHRDLKPANILITPSDQVKVLDFGLAKGRVAEGPFANSPTGPTSSSPTLLHSPTIQTPATMPGVILGTAAYLSPEQARGKVVDRRTDIWSFGCVLYECLTGKLAFDGETVSDTIAKILERDIDWSALPPATPAALRALLARCLEKDPRRRLRDIGDARLALEELKAGHSTAALAAAGIHSGTPSGAIALDPSAAKAAARARQRRQMLLAGAAFVLGAVLAIGAWSALRPGRGSRGIVHLSIPIPENLHVLSIRFVDSGDAYVMRAIPRAPAPGEEPIARLYVRRIDGDRFEPLPGTDRVLNFTPYPGGKWLLFSQPVSERSSERHVFKIPIDGSAPAADMGSWDRQNRSPVILESGEILATTGDGREYVRIPAGGGRPSAPQKYNVAGAENGVGLVRVLPRDRGVLLAMSSYVGNIYGMNIGVLDLKSGKSKLLLSGAGSPAYSPTGHLLFTRNSTLFAVPFDLGTLEVKGTPTAILQGLRVEQAWNHGGFDLADDGTLGYPPGGFVGKDRQLVMVDPAGRVEPWSEERLPLEVGAVVSPDGATAATVVANAAGLYEVWAAERGARARRIIARDGADIGIIRWSPDGRQIAYVQSSRSESDGVYVMRADGTGTPRRVIPSSGALLVPSCWTNDGSRILAFQVNGNETRMLSALVPPEGSAGTKVDTLLASTRANDLMGMLSPDNRLIAYQSDAGGASQEYVSAWDGSAPVGEAVPVAKTAVPTALWSRDGRKLFYVDESGKFTQVEIVTQPRLGVSAPRVLWDTEAVGIVGEIISLLPDGRLIGIRKGEGEGDITRIDVILGFPELVRSRLRQAHTR